jgi:hypothetical protein
MTRAEKEEYARRRRRVALLGLVLLIGFLLPVLVVRGWPRVPALRFPNFELVDMDRPYPPLVFLSLIPAAVGIGIVVLVFTTRGWVRSLGLMVLGVVPLLVVVFYPQFCRDLSGVLYQKSGACWVLGLCYVGWVGAVVASRAVRYRPGARCGPLMGAVCGILFLIGLFVPVPPRWGGWSMPLLFPLGLMRERDTFLTGVALYGQVLALLGAAGSGLLMGLTRHESRREAASRWSFGCAALAAGALTLAVFCRAILVLPWHERSWILMTGISGVLKLACWLIPLFLVLPVGMADLLVDLAPAPVWREEERDGGCREPEAIERRARRVREVMTESVWTEEEEDRFRKRPTL